MAKAIFTDVAISGGAIMSLKLLKPLLAGMGTCLMLLLTLLTQSATASSVHTIIAEPSAASSILTPEC